MDTDLNGLIVELYQGVRGVALADFKKWAFEKIRCLVPFDSGLWYSGASVPWHLHDVFLLNRPYDLIGDYMERARPLDFVWPSMRKHPGVTINSADLKSRHAFEHSEFYRVFAQHYGIECVLGTTMLDAMSSVRSIVSVWRSDALQPFTERERRQTEILTPHLVEADKMNRLFHIELPLQPGARATWATAVCEPSGMLCLTDSRFAAVLRSEWMDWSNGRIPRKLVAHLQQRQADPFVGRRIIIHAHEVGGLILLKARRKAAVDRLGKKEHQTAVFLAEGCSYQEVANLRKASLATIRNQAHSIYQKLSIMNKAQLAHALARLVES